MFKKIFLVFAIAFVLNLVWENLHAPLYVHYQGGEITSFILARAALWDAIVITLLSLLALKWRKGKNLSLILALVIAIGLERFALSTGRWAYQPMMPIIPLFNVGLSPIIQLPLLAYLSFKVPRIGK